MERVEGLLLIDKPQGWTSFDVVNKIRRIVADHQGVKPKSIKVGHTGTLDPMATGLLVICVGKSYTRLAAQLTASDKDYEFTARLNASSTTGDAEGDITEYRDEKPTKEQVLNTLKVFVGEIQQVPPAYSAIKINGQPAYKLARRGEPVKIESRTVTVRSLDLISYDYPELKAYCNVSKGTYIRTLAEDIAGRLETHAYLTALRRTSAGSYGVGGALDPETIDIETIQKHLITLTKEEIDSLTLVK